MYTYIRTYFRVICKLTNFFLLFIISLSKSSAGQDINLAVHHEKTISGVEFGIVGEYSKNLPKPVLFILANTIDETLGSDYFRQCGTRLVKENDWLCVSLDLPYHGKMIEKDIPDGLTGWAAAVKIGRGFVDKNNERMREILNYLIEKGYTDADRVAVCGTSRGGYLAFQFAAFEPRVKAVVAFAPVTDLLALKEFSGMTISDIPSSFNLYSKVDLLAQKAVWIVIGDRDIRVGTDKAIQFARKISRYSVNSNVELNVMVESKGHTTPKGSVNRAVSWILENMNRYK
jgi:dienelactone hydrolase